MIPDHVRVATSGSALQLWADHFGLVQVFRNNERDVSRVLGTAGATMARRRLSPGVRVLLRLVLPLALLHFVLRANGLSLFHPERWFERNDGIPPRGDTSPGFDMGNFWARCCSGKM